MIRLISVIFLLTVLLSACQSNSKKHDSINPPAEMSLLPSGELYYHGETEDENIIKLIKLAERQDKLPDTLIINSKGGDVFGGMRLGRWLHDNQIKVIVKNYCGSSCANYIITGAAEVTIKEGALIGWHGGSLQEDWDTAWYYYLWPPLIHKINQLLITFIAEEKLFFQSICVSQDITTAGLQPDLKKQRTSSFWTYRNEDFNKFGVNHFRYEGPITTNKDGVQVYILDLQDFQPTLPAGCL